jgi:predicted NUDIX family NTP pyrophosphohydrolase
MTKITCGLFIISENKLLVVHATNSKKNLLSIPKGVYDEEIDESHLDAAIRETFEETNLEINFTAGIINDLGLEEYKNGNKILHGFYFKSNIDLTKKNDYICNSYFEYKGKNFPEVDKIFWIDLNSKEIEYLHHTQQTLLKKIIK